MQMIHSYYTCIVCDNNKVSVISERNGCNSLKINEDKTEFIIFSRNLDKYRDIKLQIGTDNIKPSDYVKILGVTLNSSMKMQRHCKYMSHNLHAYPKNPKHQMLFE